MSEHFLSCHLLSRYRAWTLRHMQRSNSCSSCNCQGPSPWCRRRIHSQHGCRRLRSTRYPLSWTGIWTIPQPGDAVNFSPLFRFNLTRGWRNTTLEASLISMATALISWSLPQQAAIISCFAFSRGPGLREKMVIWAPILDKQNHNHISWGFAHLGPPSFWIWLCPIPQSLQ